MVIDTSVIIAIMQHESGYETLVLKMAVAPFRKISAVSYTEAASVLLGRLSLDVEEALDRMLDEADIMVVPVDVDQAHIALDAYRRFGKRRHPAKLNLGDCFSYALARQTGEPLLFKGNDFAQTDLLRA